MSGKTDFLNLKVFLLISSKKRIQNQVVRVKKFLIRRSSAERGEAPVICSENQFFCGQVLLLGASSSTPTHHIITLSRKSLRVSSQLINSTMSSWFWDDSGDLSCACAQENWQIWPLWSWARPGLCAPLRGRTPAPASCTAGWSSTRPRPRAPGASACCVSSAMWSVVAGDTFRSTASPGCLSAAGWGWGTWWEMISEKQANN